MGKVCAVPGCNSGSAADIKQRQADEVRKCSTFGVPKDPLLRQVWARELGLTDLKNNDRICELHFDYADLNISDDLLIINGEIIVSVRERITLKSNARPLKNVTEAYLTRKARESEYCLNRKKEYWVDLPQASKDKLKPVDDVQRCNAIVPQDAQMAEVQSTDIINTQIEGDQMNVEFAVGKDITSNDCHYFSNRLNISEPVSISVPILIDILQRSPLKENWAWGKKDGDLIFTNIDPDEFAVRCYLQVNSNMTVTIFLCDKEKLFNFTGITEIKTFHDLTEILQRLENQRLCLGTGISEKTRSKTCHIEAKTGARCSLCFKEKMKLENHKLSDENKYCNLLKDFRALVKKYDYSKKKLNEARQKIAELEKQINNFEINYEDTFLERIPEVQREIVSMFIKFADLDSNRIRYSREWIRESFVMHTKSSALYEYIRKRGILPLPSANTLKTQTGSMEII